MSDHIAGAAGAGGASAGAVFSIETDFAAAAVPQTDFARDLATHTDTLEATGNIGNLKFVAQGGAKIYFVNPYVLRVKPGWNCRNHNSPENREHVLKLAGMIARAGVEEALTVHLENGRFYITDGHCRFLAVMHAINHLGATIKTVPIKEENKYSSEADRLASQMIRNSGKQLEPLEQGELYHRLIKYGWTEQQIADMAGYTRGRIVQILELYANTTPRLKEMITTGAVKPSFVGRIIRKVKKSPEQAESVVAAAIDVAKSHGKSKASARHVAALVNLPAASFLPAADTAGAKALGVAPSSAINGKFVNIPDQVATAFEPQGYTPIAVEAADAAPSATPVDAIRNALLNGEIFKSEDKFMIRVGSDVFHELCRAVGIHECNLLHA